MTHIDKINQILARCIGVELDTITGDQHLIFDLMADSVALIDISIEIEQAFGFVVTEKHIQQFGTVAKLYSLVEEEQSV